MSSVAFSYDRNSLLWLLAKLARNFRKFYFRANCRKFVKIEMKILKTSREPTEASFCRIKTCDTALEPLTSILSSYVTSRMRTHHSHYRHTPGTCKIEDFRYRRCPCNNTFTYFAWLLRCGNAIVAARA